MMVSFLLMVLGPMLQLSDWVPSLSPFHRVPSVTGSDTSWAGLLVVGIVEAVLLLIGLIGFRRRDTSS